MILSNLINILIIAKDNQLISFNSENFLLGFVDHKTLRFFNFFPTLNIWGCKKANKNVPLLLALTSQPNLITD